MVGGVPGGSGRTPTRRPSNPEPKIPELPSALAASTRGAWTRTPDAGTPPLPRYQHATVIVNHRVYIVGGSYRGRFIGDVHEFDLDTSSWRRVECVDARGAPAPLSPCAGTGWWPTAGRCTSSAGDSKGTSAKSI